MAKVNDKNIYPVKPKPTSDDILFGSDSEKNYKSSNFKIADITDVIKEDINFDDIANIPKNTSQLVNDGEDGVHNFVDSVGLDTAISDVKDEILGITDDKISDSNSEIEANLKDYADTNKKLLEAQMELQDKALRGELTNKESELLQALENQRREQEKKLDEVSESLTTDLDTLKNQVDKESGEVQDAINNFQNQLNGLPTDVELTEVQLENLRFLLNTVEAEYADINFKITVVLRDQLLPAEQKPILEVLQLSTRVVYNELRDSINQALLDKTLTEEEKLTINTNLDAFRLKITEINLVLIDMYDLIGEGRKDMIEQQIKDSIVNLEPKVEYSPDKVTWHSGEFRDGIDFYMRIKYGDKGDWSNPIRIVGENGSDGKYQANEFSKNTSLTNPPTSGWQDAPPTANANEYIWMRVGDVIPPATEPSYWTAIRLTGGKGADGKDGQNAIVIDLTNDNSSVPATFEGVVLGDIPGTKVIVYEGSSIGSGWLFSADFGNASGTIDSSTGDVVVKTISDDLTNIKITATKQGYSSLTINYTVSKVRAGEPGNGESASVYYLSISENVVKVNNKGVVTPSSLSAKVYLKIGSSDPILSSDTSIKYQYNDGQEISYTTPITVDKNKTMITFRAYSGKGELLDLESVPIIRDGTDGKDGAPGKDGTDGLQGSDGTNGIDGKTAYTHIAYADTIIGAGMSFTDGNKAFIGLYYDFTEANSTDPLKYKWSKWKGEDGKDGDKGIPGTPGSNGKTPYFHTAWATNSTGTAGFSTSVSLGKTYMGTYSDFTEADSNTPSLYKWSLIKGTDGTNGIDGKTSYTHIAYADNSSGGGFSQNSLGKAYVGMYVDFTQVDSTDVTKYKWSLIKGADGAQGIPGKAGADGRTPYFHTAWANSEDGKTGFSTTVSKDKYFIGTYTDFTQADSTDSTKYRWSKIRGESIVSATEPTGKYIGMVWIDTSKSPIEQKYWNGTVWILTGVSQSDIAKAIKDANDALKKTMEDALEDGIISNNEALEIANNIASLVSTKNVLDSKYQVVYNDKLLSATKKTDLQNKKTDFDLKHTALLNVCIAISKKTSVTPAEVADYKAKQTAYNTSLSALSKALEEAQNEIFINGIDGIEVGGKNLFTKYISLNSGFFFSGSSTNGYYEQYYMPTAFNKDWLKHGSLNNDSIRALIDDTVIKFLPNTVYTIKVEYKVITRLGGTADQSLCNLGFYYTDNTIGASALMKGNIGYEGTMQVSSDPKKSVKYVTMTFYYGGAFDGNIGIYRGTIIPDWQPAPEDIDSSIQDAINNAAQAQNIANAANSKVNFLTATSDSKTGLISGGALLVGDSVGNNAGVVGTSEDGQSSVRFYAGAPYNQKKVAPFRVLNNGKVYANDAFVKGEIYADKGTFGGFIIQGNTLRSANNSMIWYGLTGVIERYDKNGTLRHRQGVDANGDPEDTWYDAGGNVMYTIDSRGTHWSQFVPESYKGTSLWRITNAASFTKAQLQTLVNNNTAKKQGTGYVPSAGPEFPDTWYGLVSGHTPNAADSSVGYSYSAGNNPESYGNKQYEGFLYTSTNKQGAKVPDGWYLNNTLNGVSYAYRRNDTTRIGTLTAIRVVGGKVSSTTNYTAQFNGDCNFKPGETSTSPIPLGTITIL